MKIPDPIIEPATIVAESKSERLGLGTRDWIAVAAAYLSTGVVRAPIIRSSGTISTILSEDSRQVVQFNRRDRTTTDAIVVP
jgi:hypothetical protein